MKIDELRLAKLIFAARKRKGYTQSYISQETGITQGTLSKIEAGVCSVSAKHWFLLSRLLDIPTESVWSGLIDRGVKPGREVEKNTFKLPKKYFTNAHSSVKEIIPIMEFVIQEKGKDQLETYLKSLKMVDYFFYDLNNKINFNFAIDLLKHFYPDQLGDELYKRIGGLAKEELYHGVHASEYRKKNTGLNLLKNYIDNSAFYQDAYKYKILEKGSDSLEFIMESTNENNDEIEKVLIPFKKAYLEQLTKMDDDSQLDISVSKSESNYTFKAQTRLS
jgi:transcriptional regulator with XRE-family HTH domain